MSLYSDELDKHYILDDFENKLKRKSNSWSFNPVKSEEDKRARREVANNNERRRMQSINTGFENLRKLLPHCVENEKISKASILQTTAKYILELKTKINCLENDILQSSNRSTSKCSDADVSNISVNECIVNVSPTLQVDCKPMSAYLSDLGSSTSSLATDTLSSSTMSLKSCDPDSGAMVYEPSLGPHDSVADNNQPQSTLEYLLAAVAQVERQEALQITNDSRAEVSRPRQSTESGPSGCYEVAMKPTISPYAEKIIQDVNNMSQPYSMGSTSSLESSSFGTAQDNQQRFPKIAIPHKYLHRPEVVLCRSKNS